MLDDYKPHLHQRWNQGCTTIGQLHREVTALGFRGSYATACAYLVLPGAEDADVGGVRDADVVTRKGPAAGAAAGLWW
jgi:hypothetical protein